MKTRIYAAACVAIGVLITAAAMAQTAATTAPSSGGYLQPSALPDAIKLLPPPPAKGSTRDADDRAIFLKTRALRGQPRWTLATEDANLSPGPALFACALGTRLDEKTTPTVFLLFHKVASDAKGVINPPKDKYGRERPYLALSSGGDGPPICVAKSNSLAKSPSYPSGHSTLSWAWGSVLAELAPDRATEILMRARAIGESRVVCGVHYASDVEFGRTNGAALVVALNGNAAFRADMDKARAELAAARASSVSPGDCTARNEAAAHPPY